MYNEDDRAVLRQSVPSWLELELARAKKLELGWVGLAQRQGQNPSLAWLGLEIILNFRAELGKIEIYELSSARARGK